MKRTSNGMQRKGSPSGEKHHFPQSPMVPPKYMPATESWWARTDKPFTELQSDNQPRMSRVAISIPHKDAIDR